VLPMRKSLAALLLGVPFGLSSPGDAQEVASDTAKETPGRYFSKPVDLWKTGRSLTSPPQHVDSSDTAPERVAVRENVWAQPIRTPDGSWMIYVPPKQVLDFLEAPSEATARAYLSWKAEQSQKLRHAMTLLAQVKDAMEAPLEASNEASAKLAPQDFPFRITYFKKASCPHCVSQDAVLTEWLTRRSLGKVDVVLPGERPELWKAYQVGGTPTLILEAGSESRKEVLVGFQSEAALEMTLAKLAFTPPDPASDLRKESSR
jgi:hypothetical protein